MKEKIFKIVLLGNGNVASQLLNAFKLSKNSKIVQIWGRSDNVHILGKKHKIDSTTDIESIKDADLYIIAVSDSSIKELSSKLPFNNKLVAHTSGATNISNLNSKNRKAVFYPLQTFTKGKTVDFSRIPICLESEHENDLKTLKEIASSISLNVNEVSSEQREYLHASAVFVNNFVNHMFHIGKEIADHHDVDFELLKPLIKETVDKIKTSSPKESQTGPAVRGDNNTLEKHLKIIPNEKHKEIYRLITESIFDTYN